MKKILIVAVMMLGFTFAAFAQPRSLGGRFGYCAEVSYQHSVGRNFLEIDGGVGLDPFIRALDLGVTGVYNFMIAKPQWTDHGEWGFYGGPGVGLGLESYEKGGNFPKNFFTASAVGMIGLEYTFQFPLQLSFDFRQHLGLRFRGHMIGPVYPLYVAVSARYRF